jgi:hypothetical protein
LYETNKQMLIFLKKTDMTFASVDTDD